MSDVSYFHCLSVPKSAFPPAGRIPSTSVPLTLYSGFGEAQGTVFCKKERKARGSLGQVRMGWGLLQPDPAQLCPVCAREGWDSFPQGFCALTSSHQGAIEPPCTFFVPSVYRCQVSGTKHRWFTPLTLFLCQCWMNLPELQDRNLWELGVSGVQFRALQLAAALNCPLKVPVSVYWLQKVLTESSFWAQN